MEICAISLSNPLPSTTFEAKVHSVFRHTINIQEKSSGEIIALLTKQDTDQPGDIRLDCAYMKNCWNIYTNQTVVYDKNYLHFERSPLIINLTNASRVECRFPALSEQPPANVSSAYSRLQSLIVVKEMEMWVKNQNRVDYYKKCDELLSNLSSACVMQDLPEAATAINGLIGLGPGLTPSGDDMLVGFLAGISAPYFAINLQQDFVHCLIAHIRQASQKTNEISRKYIHYALGGYFFIDLIKIYHAICFNASQQLTHLLLERIYRKGYTSGFDLIIGLKAALNTLQNRTNQSFPIFD